MLKLAVLAASLSVLVGIPVASAEPGKSPPGQVACAPQDEVHQKLATHFGEEVVAVAVTEEGQLMEMLVAKDTGTWSILLTQPTGLSCLASSGEGWRLAPIPDMPVAWRHML